MPGVKPRSRYRIARPLKAVKLEEHPGSSLRNPTATLVEIPVDVILEAEGGVAHSGLINVLWNGQAFSVFFEDLRDSADVLSSAEA